MLASKLVGGRALPRGQRPFGATQPAQRPVLGHARGHPLFSATRLVLAHARLREEEPIYFNDIYEALMDKLNDNYNPAATPRSLPRCARCSCPGSPSPR
jgi:hypothetical protein